MSTALIISLFSIARGQQNDTLPGDVVDAPSDDFYILNYKQSGRVIRIEKPPTDDATTPIPKEEKNLKTELIIDPKAIGEIDEEDEEKFHEDFNNVPGFVDPNVRILDQSCVTQEPLNRAIFTVCNDGDETLILTNIEEQQYGKQQEDRLVDGIEPETCEEITMIGDDTDLQFDCSGIFSLTFEVLLKPSNRYSFFRVPIKVSDKPSE